MTYQNIWQCSICPGFGRAAVDLPGGRAERHGPKGCQPWPAAFMSDVIRGCGVADRCGSRGRGPARGIWQVVELHRCTRSGRLDAGRRSWPGVGNYTAKAAPRQLERLAPRHWRDPPLSLRTPCGGTGRPIASSAEPPDHRTADVPALAPVSGRRGTSKRSRGGAHWRHDPPRADLMLLGLGGKPGMRPLAPAKPNGCRNRLRPVRCAEFLKYAPEMKRGGNFFNADLPSYFLVGFAFKEQ